MRLQDCCTFPLQRSVYTSRLAWHSPYLKLAGSEGDSGTNVTERPYSPTSSSGRIGEPPIVISGVCTASQGRD